MNHFKIVIVLLGVFAITSCTCKVVGMSLQCKPDIKIVSHAKVEKFISIDPFFKLIKDDKKKKNYVLCLAENLLNGIVEDVCHPVYKEIKQKCFQDKSIIDCMLLHKFALDIYKNENIAFKAINTIEKSQEISESCLIQDTLRIRLNETATKQKELNTLLNTIIHQNTFKYLKSNYQVVKGNRGIRVLMDGNNSIDKLYEKNKNIDIYNFKHTKKGFPEGDIELKNGKFYRIFINYKFFYSNSCVDKKIIKLFNVTLNKKEYFINKKYKIFNQLFMDKDFQQHLFKSAFSEEEKNILKTMHPLNMYQLAIELK